MRRQIQRVQLICSVFFVAICADFGGAKWLRRFILLSFFSSLVPWRFLQLKIIFRAKMVGNSASRTILRILTRLTSKKIEVMMNILSAASLYFQTVRFLNFRILNNSSFFLFIPPLFNLYHFKAPNLILCAPRGHLFCRTTTFSWCNDTIAREKCFL